jgi:UDP-glucose 4-epimerase
MNLDNDTNKYVLVTGGAGFIGSNLIKELLSKNNKVISIDNYFLGKEDNHHHGAEYIKGHTKDIEKHIREIPDIVYHLGEYSRVEQSLSEIEKVWEYNIAGTYSVLEFCRKNKIKIIYAGSSTKFGDGGLTRDQTPYAWTKAVNTEIVKNYGNWYGLDYAITYFYNVYGDGEISNGKYATVIALFKELYTKGKPLTVVSPGTQIRYFTHVDDIIRGLLIVGEYGSGDEYGLGVNKGYSIIEIANMFGGEIVMLPKRSGNRLNSTIDTKKSELLGWKPENKIEDYVNDITKQKYI